MLVYTLYGLLRCDGCGCMTESQRRDGNISLYIVDRDIRQAAAEKGWTTSELSERLSTWDYCAECSAKRRADEKGD